MPDMSAIATALSSLNAAKDIAQAMIALRDREAFQSKLLEFQSKLLDANNAAFAAQDERSVLLERVRNLEKEVARLEAWDTEKQRYQLTNIGDRTFAYAIKEAMSKGEPPHYVCTNCYEQAKKSILHHTQMGAGGHLLTCPSCNAKLIVRHGYVPPSYVTSPEEKARLSLPRCPLCPSGRLKTAKVEKDPLFGDFGVQQLTLKCDHCGHVETRQHDPAKQ